MTVSSIKLPGSARLIVWIRRELRLHDNEALWSACRDANEVIPVFIIDEDFSSSAPAQQQVIIDALHELQRSLRRIGGALLVRQGDASHVLPALMEQTGSDGVYCSRMFDPESRKRDALLRKKIEGQGKLWIEFQQHLLFTPGEILNGSGKPYTVFTPFKNTCSLQLLDVPPPLPAPQSMKTPELDAGTFPERHPSGAGTIHGGEEQAFKSMSSFFEDKLLSYKTLRDSVGIDGTSLLSHHLATGALSIRTLVHETLRVGDSLNGSAKQSVHSYVNELLWREFYYHVMWNFPHVTESSFKPVYDRLEWSGSDEWFDAWCNGTTGYPIVDAAMRQLATGHWMHNRARMIVASFLTKHLHIDWRRGERYFLSLLADGDRALNNGGWQWSAGTGTDAQPWFRIFNPVLQGKTFDPQGTYVRKYAPELVNVPSRYIHEPWKLSVADQQRFGCVLGVDYPSPIIDLTVERNKALAIYKSVSSTPRPEHYPLPYKPEGNPTPLGISERIPGITRGHISVPPIIL